MPFNRTFPVAVMLFVFLAIRAGAASDTREYELKLLNAGSLLYNQSKYKEALEPLLEGLALCERLNDGATKVFFLIMIIDAYSRLGEYKKALLYSEKFLKISEETGKKNQSILLLNRMGTIYGDLSQFKEALECYLKALRIQMEIGDTAGAAAILSNVGLIYQAQGDYEEALENYELLLRISEGSNDIQNKATALNNIGTIFDSVFGEYEKALDYYQKSLEIYQQIGNKKLEWISLLNVGLIYNILGDYEKALQYFEKSLKILRDTSNKTAEVAPLNAIGLAYYNLGEYQKSLEYLEESLKMEKEFAFKSWEAYSLQRIGFVFHKLRDYKKALHFFESSFALSRDLGSPVWKFASLKSMGDANVGLHQDDQAIDCYIKSIDTLESIRGKLTVEEHKTEFMKDKMDVYDKLIKLLLKKKRSGDAWQYAERAKARTFLDMLGNQKINYRAKAAPDLVKREEELDNAITATRVLLEKEEKRERQRELFRRIEALEKEYEETMKKLKRSNPEYASLKKVDVAALEDVQRSLPGDCLILEYYIGTESSVLFVIGKNQIETEEIPLKEKDIKDKVNALRKKIVTNVSCTEQVKELSDALIPATTREKMKDKKQLIIIPHGPLHYLPFSVLTDSTGESLVKNFEILTEPSCSVWKLCISKKKKLKDTLAAYALGDMKMSPDQGKALRGTFMISSETLRAGFSPLPATKGEVESIGKLYRDNVVLISKDMNFDGVSNTIKGKSLVHFATHGILNPLHPMFSGLLLSDRVLTTADIFGLDCDPDLVVLSACNTVGGKIVSGDELEGLSRAFMYAGASTVVASLWSVSDESTAKLMQEFYTELSKGRTESEAMRMAQLRIMKEYPGPFYWAPFIVIGD